ncbi:MAG: prepilin-type N-terminal cleavage/methylation domain-containing protein [Candidatus Omnitrophica bacterium]|nr:prepilin-type N-terminal cleavage/methylation domain-containing protein [Candidatus Omnitrophota bacterium]
MTHDCSHPQLSLPAGRQGFTLTEIMMVTSIFSVVSLVVMGALAASNDFWKYGNATLDANARAARGLQRMVGELRNTLGSGVSLNMYVSWDNYQYFGFCPLTDLDGDGTVYNATTGALEYDRGYEVAYLWTSEPGGTGELRRQTYRWTPNPPHYYYTPAETNELVATGISRLRFIADGLPYFDPNTGQGWGCWFGNIFGDCPAIKNVRIEVESTQQVFDKGGYRPITKTATTTLTLIHENVPPTIPLTYNVALTSQATAQESVYTQFTAESVPQ